MDGNTELMPFLSFDGSPMVILESILYSGSNTEVLKCNGISPEIILKWSQNVSDYRTKRIGKRELCLPFL